MSRKFPVVFGTLATLVVLITTAFAADLPSPWRAWRYSRTVPKNTVPGPTEIPLSADLLAHSANHLADLRLIDDLGHEVPYLLKIDSGGDPVVRSTAARLRENSYVPGQFTQVVLEIQGDNSVFHNTVRIETPETDFINWVEVATSDDARLWRIVKARAPISRFRKEGLEGSQTVHYSDTSSRYLRLRIFEPTGQFVVSGAEILSSDTREPARELVHANFQPDTASPPNVTRWQADLSSNPLSVNEVVFTTTQPEFYRAARIFTSEDGKEWNFRCGGEIYRYQLGGKTEELLRIRFYEDWGPRVWRVEVLNGNDAPLSGAVPSLVLTPRRLFFLAAQDRSYRLIYANAAAIFPQYDLGHFPSLQGNLTASTLAPGDEESTSNYADPRPFTERHPNLLWLALGLAVALLGYAALRALRTPPEEAQ
jgi:hypothetical protein